MGGRRLRPFYEFQVQQRDVAGSEEGLPEEGDIVECWVRAENRVFKVSPISLGEGVSTGARGRPWRKVRSEEGSRCRQRGVQCRHPRRQTRELRGLAGPVPLTVRTAESAGHWLCPAPDGGRLAPRRGLPCEAFAGPVAEPEKSHIGFWPEARLLVFHKNQ